jgi:hypothetical protein
MYYSNLTTWIGNIILKKIKGRHGLLFAGVKMEVRVRVRVRDWAKLGGCIYFWQRRGDN